MTDAVNAPQSRPYTKLIGSACLALVVAFVFLAASTATALAGPAPRCSSYEEISGSTRYDTAAEIATAAGTYNGGVIICSGEKFPDALSATALSGAKGYPILLSSNDSLPEGTLQALQQLEPENIMIIGSSEAVSDSVAAQLREIADQYRAAHGSTADDDPVTRLEGPDRFGSNRAVYEYGQEAWGSTLIVTSGTRFPDACSISPLAVRDKAPVLYVDGYGELPAETLQLIEGNVDRIDQVVITGDTVVVSQDTEDALSAMFGDDAIVRLGGNSRYMTSLRICQWLQQNKGFSTDNIAITTGENFPDALTVGYLQGTTNSLVLLADYSSAIAREGYRTALQAGMLAGHIRFIGTAAAVTQAVRNEVISGITVDNAWTADDEFLITPRYATNVYAAPDESSPVLWTLGYRFLGYRLSDSWYTVLDYTGAIGYVKAGDLKTFDRRYFSFYLDAGHGTGNRTPGVYDPGAQSPDGLLKEAVLNTWLANRVATIARDQYGLSVYVNNSGYFQLRHTDAVNRGCDAFISIHFNSGGGTGYESYIRDDYPAPGSDILQDYMHQALKTEYGLSMRDRGEKSEDYAVLSGPLPAVLLEVAFIDSGSDMSNYDSKKEQIAQSLARAMYEYQLDDRTECNW